ncbi:MAG TPA: SAM-dependent methyltransferase, partial [Acidimicrobiia bacterium]|nr:SAM-dependent methyltransferase [Acidimicrobiia bacterium]
AGALAVGRDLPAPEPGAPGPFALADAAYTRGLLTHAGFTELSLEPVDEPFLLGSDAADAAGFTAGLGAARMLLAGLDDDDRRRALDSLEATMAAHETPDGVVFGSASWVITAHRP